MDEKPRKSKKRVAHSWGEYRKYITEKFGEVPFRLWICTYFWYLFVYRRKGARATTDTLFSRHRGLIITGAVAVFLVGMVVGVALFSRSPRSVLQQELLSLAEQYYEEHSAAVDDKWAGTVSLTVDLLRAGGYNVRKFERYECDGRDTNILIRADATDSKGYKVMNYNIACRRLGK